MSAQQAFSTDFLLMWKWGESKGFDVATDSTQIMPSCHALKLAWGEHWFKSLVLKLMQKIWTLSTSGSTQRSYAFWT